jgi:hypothetical protein
MKALLLLLFITSLTLLQEPLPPETAKSQEELDKLIEIEV